MGSEPLQQSSPLSVSQSLTKANFDICKLMHVPPNVASSYPEAWVKHAHPSMCVHKENSHFIILSLLIKAKKETRKQIKNTIKPS